MPSIVTRMGIRVAAAIGLLACARGASAGDPRYTASDLGNIGGGLIYPSVINNNGEIVGSYVLPDNKYRAFVYKDGALSDVGTLGGAQGILTNVNDAGMAVGLYVDSNQIDHAVFYDGTHAIDPGIVGRFDGINNLGQAVGSLGPVPATQHGFLYDHGQITDLGTLAGGAGFSYAASINDKGQIAGESFVGYRGSVAVWHIFLYENGRMNDVGSLGGSLSGASAINNAGQITGKSGASDPDHYVPEHIFLYSNGTLSDLGGFGGLAAAGYDINSNGDIVGSASYPSGNFAAFLYTDGALHDLNDLTTLPAGYHLREADGINDHGQIVGLALDAANGYHMMLLTPIPEPASASILCALILLRRCRCAHAPSRR